MTRMKCSFILEGEGTLHTKTGKKHVIKGDAIFFPEGEEHHITNTGLETLKLLYVLCYLPLLISYVGIFFKIVRFKYIQLFVLKRVIELIIYSNKSSAFA